MANDVNLAIDKVKNDLKEIKAEMIALQKLAVQTSSEIVSVLNKSGGGKTIQDDVKKINAELGKLNKTKNDAIVVNGKIKVQESQLAKFQLMKNKQHQKEIELRQKQVEKVSQLEQRLRKLKEAENKLASKAMTGRMIESVNAIGKTNDGLKKLNQYYKALEKNQIKQANAIAKENAERIKANKERIREANMIASNKKALQNQRQQAINDIKKQQDAIKKANAERIREADAIERNKKALQKQKEKSIELSRAYVQLVNRQKQAKKVLQDLIVSQGKNSAQTKKAQKEYDKLTAKVNLANKATSNFSKTGLGSMARGFKNLLGAFGIVGGIQLFADFARQSFEVVKKLQSLNFALRTVTDTTKEFLNVKGFLRDVTQKYGLDLVSITERFTKFLAAAKQSNITLKVTKTIFESFSKAAGVLGLKTDEVSGVFLALEQMLSKGKVTTEELRRQLGERLPGAFGIMAYALGVSIEKLDEMLKKGEVLSKDALPKLAKAIEVAYGIENIKRIDTIVAAQNRFNNSFKLLIDNFTDSEKSGRLLVILFNTLTYVMTALERNLTAIANGFGKLQLAFTFLSERFPLISMYFSKMASDLKTILNIMVGGSFLVINNLFKDLTNIMVGLGGVLDELIQRFTRFSQFDFSKPIESLKRYRDNWVDLGDAYRKATKDFEEYQKKQKEDQVEKDRLKLVESTAKRLVLLGKAKQEDITIEEARKKTTKLSFEELERLNKEITRQIKLLGELANKKDAPRKRASIGFDITNTRTNEVKNVSDFTNLKTLKQQKEELEIILKIEEFGLTLLEKGTAEYMKKVFLIQSIRKQLKGIAYTDLVLPVDTTKVDELIKKLKTIDTLQEAFKTVTDTFGDYFDFDTSSLDFVFDTLKDKEKGLFDKENVANWANFTKEAVGSVLDASLNRYEIELQEAQRVRDLTLNNELASEEAKANARRKYDREERRIKTEMAKKERDNTLIKIAMDTAAAVVSIWAQVPKFDFGVSAGILTAATIALGAAQAAVVASQPLPQFYTGVENSSYQGLATKDEKGAELHLDKYGNVKDFGQNKGSKLTYVEKGDTILDAYKTKEFMMNIADFDIQKMAFDMNMSSNGDILSEKIVDLSLLREVGGLRKDIDTMGRRIEKLASRKINVNNKIELKDNRAY
jgi:tape measure domain-containing protein